MVFYRKYRPQTLDQIIGQTAVKSNLIKAFGEQRLAHAYLFCGPRGTGKTSTARILAKIVNCQNQSAASREQPAASSTKKTDHDLAASEKLSAASSIPCNRCDSCMSINDGSNLDLIEIDAASNRGIDDIRSLRDNIKLAPTSAKQKVYIIDEVHMLSNEAFNALLKTLEEPPAHVLFILATTELHKIPVTILSRVQKLEFQLASITDTVAALQRVVDGEKLKVADGVLEIIARRSEGSFRDAVKLLDQLASKGEEITVQFAEESLQTGSFEQLIELATTIAKEDTSTSLVQLTTLIDRGVNPKDLGANLIDLLRGVFLIQNDASSIVKNDYGEIQYQQVESLSKLFKKPQLIQTLKSLQQSMEQIKFTSMPILAIEIAIVESTQPQVVMASPVVAAAPAMPVVQPVVSKVAAIEPIAKAAALTDDVLQPRAGEELTVLKERWSYILETIKQMNYSLEALLRAVSLTGTDESIVFIEVPYSFHQRILESPKNRDLIESIFSDVLSKPMRLAVTLGQRPNQSEDLANVEVAADDDIIRIAAEIFSSDTN